jgi:hypothetical protein
VGRFDEIYRRSLEEPEAFGAEAAEAIHWIEPHAVVERLPKTRSGKILRGTLRRIADGESYTIPATIDEPTLLDDVSEALQAIGYAKVPVPSG